MLDIQEFLKIAMSNGMVILQSQEGNNEYKTTNKELPFYTSCELCGKKMYISPASDFLSKEIVFLMEMCIIIHEYVITVQLILQTKL